MRVMSHDGGSGFSFICLSGVELSCGWVEWELESVSELESLFK